MKRVIGFIASMIFLFLSCGTVSAATTGTSVDVYSGTPTTDSWFQNMKARNVKTLIVKLTEGVTYENPKAKSQIEQGAKYNMYLNGYHYARYIGDSNAALNEAKHAVSEANRLGLPKGSIIFDDYEEAYGNINSNTQATIVFLKYIQSQGYTPGFYSGAGFSGQYWRWSDIKKAVPATKEWIAAYPTTKGVTAPNFYYFPSLNNDIDGWQYSSNWYGEDTDASVYFNRAFEYRKSTTANISKNTPSSTARSFRVPVNSTIHSGPEYSSPIVGRYYQGETLFYTFTNKSNNGTYYHYRSYRGDTRWLYVADVHYVSPQYHRFSSVVNVRTGYDTSYPAISRYYPGERVLYDRYVKNAYGTWLGYRAYNGSIHWVVAY